MSSEHKNMSMLKISILIGLTIILTVYATLVLTANTSTNSQTTATDNTYNQQQCISNVEDQYPQSSKTTIDLYSKDGGQAYANQEQNAINVCQSEYPTN
jgi:uncharacterized protein YxeA